MHETTRKPFNFLQTCGQSSGELPGLISREAWFDSTVRYYVRPLAPTGAGGRFRI